MSHSYVWHCHTRARTRTAHTHTHTHTHTHAHTHTHTHTHITRTTRINLPTSSQTKCDVEKGFSRAIRRSQYTCVYTCEWVCTSTIKEGLSYLMQPICSLYSVYYKGRVIPIYRLHQIRAIPRYLMQPIYLCVYVWVLECVLIKRRCSPALFAAADISVYVYVWMFIRVSVYIRYIHNTHKVFST